MTVERETKLQEQVTRGGEAQAIAASPLLRQFFAELKADCVKSWQNTRIDDAATREDAWRMHKALELLEQKLTTAVAIGNHARKELQTLEKEKETK